MKDKLNLSENEKDDLWELLKKRNNLRSEDYEGVSSKGRIQ